jgi:hypothetical protein
MVTTEIEKAGTMNVYEINGIAEQQFFLLLKERLPFGTQIIYEDRFFKQKNDKGKEEGTVPDFHIIKPDGKEFYIEITTQASGNNGNDPKGKAKRIMSETVPVKKYTVLYREHLLNIQRHNPERCFFNGRKIKRNEQQLALEIVPQI